jgi:hypothetical protein
MFGVDDLVSARMPDPEDETEAVALLAAEYPDRAAPDALDELAREHVAALVEARWSEQSLEK